MTEITKLSITRSFFELETPDLARKFVWTIRTKYKKYKKYKVLITQLLTDFKFCMEVHIDQITKYKSTKSSKNEKVH